MIKTIIIYTTLMIGSMVTATAYAQCCKPNDKKEANVKSTFQEEDKQLKLKITGMTCAGCASHVYKVLSETKGVLDNSVEYPGNIAIVKYDEDIISPEEIIKAIEKNTSYTAEVYKEKKDKDTSDS